LYVGLIHTSYSGKVIIIFGSNATLDAGQKGRFFNADGSKGKTSLEIHDVTLKNGRVDEWPEVSKRIKWFSPVSSISDGKKIFVSLPFPPGIFLHFPMGFMSWRCLTWNCLGAGCKSGC
jgi:hypothetical protein